MGCTKLKYQNFSFLEIVHSKKRVSEEKKRVNYYPFGLEHKGYNNVVNGTENNYKTFQGQEISKELGYNMLEFKYRHYDPAIGRFNVVDPLTEDYMDWGPYVFSGNRVIDARELEGLEPFFVNKDMSFKDNVKTNLIAYGTALKNIGETGQFFTNPVATVKGLIGLGKAIASPVETGKAIVNNVSQTITDVQSSDPNVAGPALGNTMSFVAETVVGAELANLGKVGALGKLDDVSGVTNQLQNTANKASSIVGEGSGAVHGTKVHTQFGNMAETINGVTKEASYLNGNVVNYGTKGSVRADAVYGPVNRPTAVYDLKTGGAKVTTQNINKYNQHVPGKPPVIEIKPNN